MLWEHSLSPVYMTWLSCDIPALDCSIIILSVQYRAFVATMVMWLF